MALERAGERWDRLPMEVQEEEGRKQGLMRNGDVCGRVVVNPGPGGTPMMSSRSRREETSQGCDAARGRARSLRVTPEPRKRGAEGSGTRAGSGTDVLAPPLSRRSLCFRQIYQKKEVQSRNKRMFGALMGHLGKAKDRLNK